MCKQIKRWQDKFWLKAKMECETILSVSRELIVGDPKQRHNSMIKYHKDTCTGPYKEVFSG